MSTDSTLHPERTPHIAGAGLLALDVVLDESQSPEALTFAGGTCGNVLSILSFLRWTATPVGFIGDDPAGKRVLADLATAGVKAAHLVQSARWTTPVFIQRLERDETGRPRHTFASASRCPHCGHSLKATTPKPNRDTTPIRAFAAPEKIDVFFMDRLSSDILSLADSARSRGALVYYEPSVKADMAHWHDAFELVDIVKYSADRFDAEELAPFVIGKTRRELWEVQTMGAKGLKFRHHTKRATRGGRWTVSAAIQAHRLADSCGAGDWCSAGLLHGLLGSGQKRDLASFADAARLGQLLAAWACAFVGARGAMYCNDPQMSWAAIDASIRNRRLDLSELPTSIDSKPRALNALDACITKFCEV